MPPLLGVREMSAEHGPPLPLGKQLNWFLEQKVLPLALVLRAAQHNLHHRHSLARPRKVVHVAVRRIRVFRTPALVRNFRLSVDNYRLPVLVPDCRSNVVLLQLPASDADSGYRLR